MYMYARQKLVHSTRVVQERKEEGALSVFLTFFFFLFRKVNPFALSTRHFLSQFYGGDKVIVGTRML